MSPGDAFVELWEFVEGLGLDRPTEENLKHILCVLGKAAQVNEQLLSGCIGRQDELEARFFLQMKYEEVEP